LALWRRGSQALVVCLAALSAQAAVAQLYRLERIASGLNQPTYVTQAPGDPANILYFTERTQDANPGFGASNDMGNIWRYDVDTRSRTLVLDLSQYFVTNDTGVQTIAFHPDFNASGSAGFGKLYVSHAEALGSPTNTARNRVEEYTVDLAGPDPTYAASFSRLLLQYDNNAQNNHTIDWIGFDPTATGEARNYLYVSTGDGSFGNDYNGGTSPTGRPSQNPNEIAGKMLRVDVAGPDDYPGDALKNFAIPLSNPIPTYNAANPSSPIAGLGEVYLTGLRNAYRASFDRATGDLWMGDVGEVFVEEVSFLKAGTNGSGPPVDFGWPQWEGTMASDVDGAPHEPTNPFTGAVSLNPVQQFLHDGGGEAAIGGYVYRGPVAELQGKYFYADFVGPQPFQGNLDVNLIRMLEFDRDTDPESFQGDNGTLTDVSALWQSLVFDPTDPSYGPESTTASSAGLDHIVSFGEDNAGNLYIVDFGNGSGFNGQYPGPGLGEIFRLTPIVQVKLSIDRESGEILLENQTGNPLDVASYSITSASGAIDPSNIIAITGNYDASPSGNRSFDDDDAWQITSPSENPFQFSEETTGDAGTLAAGSSLLLSAGGGWTQSIYEDLQLSLTLADGSNLPGIVEFEGNGGEPFVRSDLNFDGNLGPADWPLFRAHHLADMSGLSPARSYQLGDLDGDGDNDFGDFRIFQSDYIAVNGEAAFAALLRVPEPSTLLIIMLGVVALVPRHPCRTPRVHRDLYSCGRRMAGPRGALFIGMLSAGALLALSASPAAAGLKHRYSFNEGPTLDATGRSIIDSISGAHGTVRGTGATASGDELALPGGGQTTAYVDLPNGIISSLTNASFEAWYTMNEPTSWTRVFDFGSREGVPNGEVPGATNPAGAGADYIFYAPTRGTNPQAQRVAIRNLDPQFGGGAAGPVGGTETPTMDLEVDYTLGAARHVAVTFNSTGGSTPGMASVSVYIDGVLAPGATNPADTPIQLANLNDVNNWLGRSNWSGDQNLNGSLDEFRIYDHALSAADVLERYELGPNALPSLPNILQLQVNTVTGAVLIKNNVSSAPIELDYYHITSTGGALRVGDWESLDLQQIDSVGPGEGQSWDEAETANAFQLAELFLLGHSTVESDRPLRLGHPFNPTVFGPGENGDLVFAYGVVGEPGLKTGTVSYVTPGPLDGDYNSDGSVDAADYVLWRKTLGSTTMLDADGDGDGIVDTFDFEIWRTTFGNVAGAGAAGQAAFVPEPGSYVLYLATCIGCAPILVGRMRSRYARA
jgi:glucose/arabinose dehydrogenase